MAWLDLENEVEAEFANCYQWSEDDKDNALFRRWQGKAYRPRQQKEPSYVHRNKWLRIKANPERLKRYHERQRAYSVLRYHRRKAMQPPKPPPTCVHCRGPVHRTKNLTGGAPYKYCSERCRKGAERDLIRSNPIRARLRTAYNTAYVSQRRRIQKLRKLLCH